MEAIRYRSGTLPVLAAGALVLAGVVLALSASPARASNDQSGDYVLASPTLSINDVTRAEGNGGFTPFQFTVTMSKTSANPVRVGILTKDGSATLANLDYVAVSTVLTIPAGQLSGTVTVFVRGDITGEPDETFFVNLVNPEGAAIGDNQGIGTILNDDDRTPCLRINNVTLDEGDVGKTAFVFKVQLSNPVDVAVTVDFETQDGTATIANNDYQPTSGTLVFPAKSQLSQNIIVYVNGDVDPDCDNPEDDEVFLVKLLGANVELCDDEKIGIGTIRNDDCITPVLLSRFDGEVADDGIVLRWQFGDASDVQSSWVERSVEGGGAWAPIEAEAQVEGDLITVIDRTVEVGVEYRYRLLVRLSNGESVELDQISVTADLVKEFALGRVTPNPATGPARIDYAIPRESRVQLSIMDVQGRVVAVLVDGVLKAGRHQAVWDGLTRGGKAYPGVYFIRYQTPVRAFTKQFVLTN
jgi:hypothetical protein